VPTHETFWNINVGGIVLYPLAALSLGIFIYALVRRSRLWQEGKAPVGFGPWRRRIFSSVRLAFTEILGHRRLLRHPYPGLMHLALFWGAITLLIGTVLDSLSHYTVHFMQGRFYLVSSAILDIMGLLLLVGVGVAAYRRYVQRPVRLDNRPEDGVSLAVIALLVVSGFFVEALRTSVPEPADSGYAAWWPAGQALSLAFSGLSQGARLAWHQAAWWTHAALVLGGIVYLSLTANKLSHIIFSTTNTLLRPLGPKSVLAPIDLEKAETMGAGKIADFSWKDVLELDACTRCGRCQDNCPAHLSGKGLSPKKVVQDLKAHWLQGVGKPSATEGQQPPVEMVGGVITDQAIWDCTSCRSCEEQCPVYVRPLHKIMEMRRYLALMVGRLPDTAQASLRNMQQRGHPWAGSQYLRLRDDWLKEAGLHKLGEGEECDTLLWVGCTGALVDRNVKVTLALVRLMGQAGVKFGVLGGNETCCGDPARRLGYELQYQEMAQRNIQAFLEHKVQRIVTPCPHCFNVLKNEYPQLGGGFEVLHHSEYLARLLAQGRLKVGRQMEKRVTYHDPCYLGRYNDKYNAPREAIGMVFHGKLHEMGRSKWQSFCCGGGGGHTWVEESGGLRINEMRCEQALGTGAEIAVTACPFCLQMLENGLERKQSKDKLQILDLAEVVAQASTLPQAKTEV